MRRSPSQPPTAPDPMLRILLIPLAGCELPAWQGLGFQLERAADVEDGLARLQRGPCDAVVLRMRGVDPAAAQACARIEEACGADVVPLVLAADGRDPDVPAALERLPFDAFVDLGWSGALIARCVALAVSRVRAGRGVVEIQHQVLRAVREEVAQLRDQSLRDEVTGLYNRRAFQELLVREHARCQRQGRGYALVRLELEALAELTATHGAALAAQALARVGVALQTLTREADFAFRLGGEAFVALLPHADRALGQLFADRVVKAVRQCVLRAGEARVPLAVRAGVAVYPRDGQGADTVLAQAEAALGAAAAAHAGASLHSGGRDS